MINIVNKLPWKKQQLWEGCMLASIAHAIMVAHYPELSNEHSWDGLNYSVQDSDGARGTITFSDNYYLGAFRNANSERLSGKTKLIKHTDYFNGAPQEIKQLAEQEALQYLLQEVEGIIKPLTTTAFWGNEDKTISKDKYNDFIYNGGFLLERHIMDLEKSMESWMEYYDMTQEQCDLLKIIYSRKRIQPNQVVKLTKYEIEMIGTIDEEGLDESRISFGEIGVVWEE